MSTCFRIYLYCMSHADVLRAESCRHGNHELEGCFLAICAQVTSRMWQQSPLIKASKCDCSPYTSFSSLSSPSPLTSYRCYKTAGWIVVLHHVVWHALVYSKILQKKRRYHKYTISLGISMKLTKYCM